MTWRFLGEAGDRLGARERDEAADGPDFERQRTRWGEAIRPDVRGTVVRPVLS